MDKLVVIFNEYLKDKIQPNLKIIDVDKVIAKTSISNSVDFRYYYSSKTLYSIEFYKSYAQYIKPIFLSVNGKSKKALIFDCDNTLWKGVLGEDGFESIKIFKEIQYLALELSRKGVIIGLCSKNNPEDVDAVLETHSDIILRDKDIVIKRVNWTDKVSNLKSIAIELNVGLDSLVFLDDSDFEVNLIREELPLVNVFQVPPSEYKYSMMMKEIMNLFYNPTQTKEDFRKVKMYKDQVKRVDSKQKIGNIDEYLKSLELCISVYVDDPNEIARMSQMTQKTNQFNLTTKRYTEKDIRDFINSKNKTVVAIGVRDKFGDNGVVGLAILDYNDNDFIIDTFLMSCRVLGRNVEYKLMDIIFDIAKESNIEIVHAEYVRTLKNDQVSSLYKNNGFCVTGQEGSSTEYYLATNEYKNKNINYIEVE